MCPVFIFYCIFFFSYVSASLTASSCYLDGCRNLTAPSSASIPPDICSFMKIESTTDCGELEFEQSGNTLPIDSTAKFYLLAYVREFGGSLEKATAFNLTVRNAIFHRLTIRHQDLSYEQPATCHHTEFIGNESYLRPAELDLSCPFSYDAYGSPDWKLQVLVTGGEFHYNREYVFKVPGHHFLGENVTISEYIPFTYIDTSVPSVPVLNVQKYPERFNIKEYKICLVNNETNAETSVYVEVPTGAREKFITHNIIGGSGMYYFKVNALHPDCGELGCPISITPIITINGTSYRLLIMIVSTIWIPPAVAYALYRIYKWYKRKAKRSTLNPNCLLVYAPMSPAHVNVVTEVAKFLRAANINAMIDTLDISDASEKDLRLWANDAFGKADIMLVVSSPPSTKEAAESLDSRFELLRVLKENGSNDSKRCLTAVLPYCKLEDMPEEARNLKLFHIPQQLILLVEDIHGGSCKKVSLPCNKDLLDNIKIAESEVLKDSNILENIGETDGLLQSRSARVMAVSKDQV